MSALSCRICDEPYSECEHSNYYQTLPKDETGNILSKRELAKLIADGKL